MELHETYESLNLEPQPIRPHILAAATVVFGDDYEKGQRETINLSGFVQLNKWPMPGFGHRRDAQGRDEFDLELISAPEVGIKGFSYVLNDRIQVLSNPHLPNTGSVRQIVPGKNFPARFHIRRFGVLETSTLRLAHHDVIDIEGVVDAVPPFKEPLTRPYHHVPRGDDGAFKPVKQLNVVGGVNLPEAWYPANDDNEPVGLAPVAFFADSPAPCKSTLLDPSFIIQASTAAEMVVSVDGREEHITLWGDHAKAGGMELLLFGPEKHGGDGVLVQLARLAVVGESRALGGRVMLRVSFAEVSGGRVEGSQATTVSDLRLPARLGVQAHLEICTPHGNVYAPVPATIEGGLESLDAKGSTLQTVGGATPLVGPGGDRAGELVSVRLALEESLTGTEAYVSV